VHFGRLRRYLLRWPGREHRVPFIAVLALFGTLLLVMISLFAVGSWIAPGGFLGVDSSCEQNTFACNALTEVLATGLALAVAFASFAYWRVFRVARLHTANGLSDPSSLVPTATQMGRVVGRDAICEIIEEDLRVEDRRPQIVVGDVGEGKTAVLVRLTQLLIEHGAVPVAIDLRDAKIPLNFRDLARERFQRNVQHGLLSEDEGDKVWRKLCNDKRIVVLADGLDEALAGQPGRHTEIRGAVKKALDDRLPLVMASRPDDVLRGLDAALMRLEPLSDSDAVEYIIESPEDTASNVEKLAAAAAMTEAPLYLWLAHQLPSEERDIPTDQGRLAARVELLERWRARLVEKGNLSGSDHYLDTEREAGLQSLELMAYLSLCNKSDEVRFADLDAAPFVDALRSEERDPLVAARVGEDLDLVDRVGDGVRFRHSVLQGYLGGRAIPADEQLDRGGRIRAAIKDPRGTLTSEPRHQGLDGALGSPSREFLMALTVASVCSRDPDLPRRLERKLRRAVLRARDTEAFELLATAYEISRLTGESEPRGLGRTAEKLWHRSSHSNGVGQVPGSRIAAAKLRAVDRMEEAAGPAAHRALWTICLEEQNYAVRLRAAQALADGGELAYSVLRRDIDEGVRLGELLSTADGADAGEGSVRRCSMHGWILPTLAASCRESEPAVRHITATLDQWAALSRAGLHLGVEGCFAQGFKHAANRLPDRASDRTTGILVERTQELLSTSKWWYSQLTLLQALTLWGIAGVAVARSDVHETLAAWEGDRRHPLVREMARLCTHALRAADERGTDAAGVEPSRYLWIDEAGVAEKIGARSAPPNAKSTEGLWIPRAAGWRTLDPEARTLVAQALIFLNLIEGGEAPPKGTDDVSQWHDGRPQARERRRQAVARHGPGLPPCLVEGGRTASLAVEMTHGRPRAPDGSMNCCEFGLCPYPAPDEDPFRGELRETFCRGQQRLLRERGVPPWHKSKWLGLKPKRLAVKELTQFWARMERRAQLLSLHSMEASEADGGHGRTRRRNAASRRFARWRRLGASR
jgi:hypothetical protein